MRWCRTDTAVANIGMELYPWKPIDRAFIDVGTHVLLDLRAQAIFTESLFDEILPSDHAPIRLTLHSPRRPPPAGGPVPKWVARHPMFAEVVEGMLDTLDFEGCGAFEVLVGYTDVLRQVAREVLRTTLEPTAENRAEWVAHWLASARRHWLGGRHGRLRECLAHIPSYGHLFYSVEGEVRARMSDLEFKAALGAATQEAIMAELQRDLGRVAGDSERQSLRAKAARRLSLWSPKRRRIKTCVVLQADGTECDSVEAVAEALASDWGGVFSGCSGSNLGAAARLLQDGVVFPHELRLPSFAEFQDMAMRTPSSAPGPDGLAYGFWTSCERCTRVLYECMQALASGENPLAGFNDAIVTFISKRALHLGERVYAATPEQLRPLTLANWSQELVAKGIKFALEQAAVQSGHIVQRGFVHHRSILQHIFDLEMATEMFLKFLDADPCILLFDVAAAFPSAEHEWLEAVLLHRMAPQWLLNAMRGISDAHVNILFGGEVSIARRNLVVHLV